MGRRTIGRSIKIYFLMTGFLLSGCASLKLPQAPQDTRQTLALARVQKQRVLAEMRQLLESVNGIVQGIEVHDLEMIEKAARASGSAVAVDNEPGAVRFASARQPR